MTLLKDLFDVLANLASLVAVLGAAAWFLYTTKFKRRIQFDLDCRFLAPSTIGGPLLAEVQTIFENKGFVEHRIYDLALSADGIGPASGLNESVAPSWHEHRICSRTPVVPRSYGYYFVRPGVRQVITHTLVVPPTVSVLRITAGFNYSKDSRFPHTARRLFQVQRGAASNGSAVVQANQS